MVRIQTFRRGVICVAVNVNDNQDARVAIGLTQEGASRRLLRRLA